MKRNFAHLSSIILAVAIYVPCISHANQVVYGLDKAEHFNRNTKGNLLIQAASFSIGANADKYRKELQAKTTYPVHVIRKNHFYTVVIGPIHSTSALRQTATYLLSKSKTHKAKRAVAMGYQLPPKAVLNQISDGTPDVLSTTNTMNSNQASTQQSKTAVITKVSGSNHKKTAAAMPTPSTNLTIDPKARWFLSFNIGEQFQTGKETMYVNNGSYYPPPYNQDTYTVNKTAHASMINISGGYRWQREQNYLPAYSLGLLYQHSFVGHPSGEIIQYSDPIFTNYNYKSNLSSNLLLATAKVNIYTINKFSPYITAGLGGAFNHASYNETALPGVTPRISPDFTGNKSQFAYNAGAGLDYIASQHFIINVGYLYQNVGNISGRGQGTWSGTNLGFEAYGTNDVVVGVTYLFGK